MDDLTKGAADLIINHLLAEVEFFTVENLQCRLNRGENSGLPDCLVDGPRGVVRSVIRNRLEHVCSKFFGIGNRPEVCASTGACHTSSRAKASVKTLRMLCV